MTPTTPRLIRADFVRQIVAIAPSHPEHQDCRFRPARAALLTKTPELRNFFLDIPAPAQPVYDGIYGSGVEFEFELRVWIAYGGLAPEDDDSIITTDCAQIWSALQRRYDPALAGLISVEPNGWFDGDGGEADGHRWGFASYQIRYLQDA